MSRNRLHPCQMQQGSFNFLLSGREKRKEKKTHNALNFMSSATPSRQASTLTFTVEQIKLTQALTTQHTGFSGVFFFDLNNNRKYSWHPHPILGKFKALTRSTADDWRGGGGGWSSQGKILIKVNALVYLNIF